MPPFLIEDFDPATASDEDFRARWELVVALDAESEPESPTTPYDKHRQSMIDQPSFRRPRHWTGSDGDHFCEAVGFEKKATERKSRLAIDDVDRAMLERWVERAVERAAEYELVVFDDRCPDDLLQPFVDLWQVTNTAPRDDLDME